MLALEFPKKSRINISLVLYNTSMVIYLAIFQQHLPVLAEFKMKGLIHQGDDEKKNQTVYLYSNVSEKAWNILWTFLWTYGHF